MITAALLAFAVAAVVLAIAPRAFAGLRAAALGARFHVGVDEVSWPFALLTAALTFACCVWLWQRDTSPTLVSLLMVIAGASLGVFVAQDLLLFFIFFEFALVPMWFVIARW